jgi:hypothetical protein
MNSDKVVVAVLAFALVSIGVGVARLVDHLSGRCAITPAAFQPVGDDFVAGYIKGYEAAQEPPAPNDVVIVEERIEGDA